MAQVKLPTVRVEGYCEYHQQALKGRPRLERVVNTNIQWYLDDFEVYCPAKVRQDNEVFFEGKESTTDIYNCNGTWIWMIEG